MKWFKDHWVTVVIVLLLLWGLYYYGSKNGGLTNVMKQWTGKMPTTTSPSGVTPG